MRDLTFSLFESAKTSTGETESRPWSDWLRIFSTHDVRGRPEDTASKEALDLAKDGPAVLLGKLKDGGPRRNSNVEEIHAFGLDIEGRPDEEILEALKKLTPFEFALWTTHKHGSEVAGPFARIRIVLPLARPIPAKAYREAWGRMNLLVGGLVDPMTKDLARLHYLPSTFDPKKANTIHNPGKWIDVMDLPEMPRAAVEASPKPAPAKIQAEALTVLGNKILRTLPKSHDLKEPAVALVQGKPFASEGSRHATMVSLTMWIALQDRDLSRASLDALFGRSLKAMATTPGAPTLEEAWTAYRGAIVKVIEEEGERRQAARERAFEAQSGGTPYAPEELKRIAEANGWTPDDLAFRWIVIKNGSGWLLTESGEYKGPYSREDLATASSRFLSRAPVRLVEMSRAGLRYRPMSDVVRECGSLADRVISDMTAARSWYDPKTRTMYEAILPLRRDLVPRFDPRIDTWIKILSGAQYEKIVDWISVCPDLTRILCAIYFDGPKGSGKTLFAHGLAKLWTEGPPAELEAVLGDFNDELSRCPLVIADEEIPKQKYQTTTTVIRSMLSTTSRTLKRKYLPTAEIRGAVRIILTANNEFLLDSRDVSSSQDLDAIAQRFLYIQADEKSTEYLESIPRDERERWARQGIAEHCLFLAANHKRANDGGRFAVEGDVSTMHRLLMTGSRWNSLCCEWLVRYLIDPNPYNTQRTGLIRIFENELLVNDQALVDGWDLYIKSGEKPETAKIGAGLRALSASTKRKQLRKNGRQIRYRIIDVNHLISWAERYNIGDRETLLERIQGFPGEGSEEEDNVVDFPSEEGTFEEVDAWKDPEERS